MDTGGRATGNGDDRSGGDRPVSRSVFRRPRLNRRVLSAGTGGLLVGALVFGATTASGANSAISVTPTPEPTVIAAAADIVPGDPVSLLGFAPPPKKVAPPPPQPQFRISADLPSGPLGIPGVVLQAYKLAANRMGAESPQCKLPWFLLAGIGRIESNHASNGSVDAYGNTINPILGPVLDGSLPGNAVISDGQGGHARAMGPMQFIPGTWAAWGSDANGDGRSDPHNIFDATYAAGRYLCAGITDITVHSNEVSAVFRYNHSMEYVANVLAWAAAYATGVMPTNPIPEPKRKADKSSSSKSSKPKKPSSSAPEESSPESSTPQTTTPTPRQTCIGVICLPPDLIPPQLLPPQQKQLQTTPKKKAPTTSRTPAPKSGASTVAPTPKQVPARN
ncbi:hypothetical protein GORHZ_166_00020 [Gordonia rhizosphera NBRC 16068]|uniref:Transglycosylase SLT domain-containing protein n=1 Tax=Gordonia rhizosphera NBRC 16068 TaxID=1108045 RepID=K6X037_9ACTN|nr:hypothetical protein GORHZ_166_00020 [Gordonia rhizosphera NBRC 16068]